MRAVAEMKQAWPARSRASWRVFAALLVVWLLVAAMRPGDDAQDVVPFLVAGELIREHPDAVYVDAGGGIYDVDPRFRDASCPRMRGLDCEAHPVAFVSPPGALPLLVPLAELPNDLVVRAFRLLNAGALVAGMLLLWRRLASRSDNAPVHLAASVVLLTPFAMVPIGLGQTSPLMFLSAALGVSIASRNRWWAVIVGALWAVNVLSKAVPALLGLLLLWQRRWRLVLAVGAGVLGLTLLALWIGGGFTLLGDFLASGGAVQEDSTRSRHTGSIESAVRDATGLSDASQLTAIGMAVRSVALVAVVGFLIRLRDEDVVWAIGWAALVALSPLNWWHYGWVLVATLGVVLWRTDRSGQHIWLLPVLAATTVPLGLAALQNWRIPVVPMVWMFAVLIVCCALARPVTNREPMLQPARSP